MSRTKNDGRGRLGGREKGTPNKLTADLKTWIAEILDDGRAKFVESLNDLESSEYIRVYTSLLNYVIPKQQAVCGEVEESQASGGLTIIVKDEEEKKLIEDAMRNL